MTVQFIYNRVGNIQDLSVDIRLAEGGAHIMNLLLPDFQYVVFHNAFLLSGDLEIVWVNYTTRSGKVQG